MQELLPFLIIIKINQIFGQTDKLLTSFIAWMQILYSQWLPEFWNPEPSPNVGLSSMGRLCQFFNAAVLTSCLFYLWCSLVFRVPFS